MHDLADLTGRLRTLLSASGDLGDDVEVTDLVQMTGGYSLRMFRFEAKGSNGMGRYVLRANPPADEALSNTDRVAEWELLDALTASSKVPMPAARWADLDGSTVGTPAFIVDLVDGPQLLALLNSVGEDEQRALALDLAATIGAVHNAGADAVPSSFERPGSWDHYIDSHIELWRATEATLAERDPFIRWLARWLETHKPPPAPLTLVHGEFQTANVVVGGQGMQVVDWEFAHVGDPRADLGWLQNVAAFSPPDPVALDPMAFCARYCEVTGLGPDVVNPLTVGYFAILSGAKALAGMLHGVTALAAGENHGMQNAYLVSALPFSHDLWRQGTAGIDAAMAMLAEQAEGAAR